MSPNRKIIFLTLLSRLKETRVSAVEKAGYVRVKVPLGRGGIFQRIPALNCVEEKIIAKLMASIFLSLTLSRSW